MAARRWHQARRNRTRRKHTRWDHALRNRALPKLTQSSQALRKLILRKREPWNHNIHYYPVVLRAVPAWAQRGLEVGCGDGMLTRQLRRTMPSVTAIDKDERSIAAARHQDGGLGIDYLHGDFLCYDFERTRFDFIASVAALHHMDAVAGLERMRALLRPGGTLVIIGCARSSNLADLPAELCGMLLHRLQVLRQLWTESSGPTLWPPPDTYSGMRAKAGAVLPGVSFRRLALWRYALVWTKPGRLG
jgi:2-polyprenyl-3-methyl-5-hydroxy-6-metoxy-1,4-benzoquinol methylase